MPTNWIQRFLTRLGIPAGASVSADILTKPTLAQIEASAVLAKEASITALDGVVDAGFVAGAKSAEIAALDGVVDAGFVAGAKDATVAKEATVNAGFVAGAKDATVAKTTELISGAAVDFGAVAKASIQAAAAAAITADAEIDNILLDTQIRKVASGTSGVIATTASKYIELDSGTNGAEILAVIINGVVGFDWTLAVYVPTADAVAAPAAGDKRDSITYLNTDTEGGLLGPFAIAYNAFLKFTNNSGGNQTMSDVVVVYRSRGAITISAWT